VASGTGWIGRALAALSLIGLTACVAPSGAAPSSPRRIAVQDGAVIATVPAGFCFETAASHDDASGAVMVAGRCAAGSDPAVISISIGTAGSSDVLKSGGRALSDWFISPAGRAALARDGRASSVRVGKTVVADGAFLLLVTDRKVGTYWRAVLGLKGRLVTVSVAAPTGQKLDETLGRQVLDRTVAGLRAAN
jgi:hypothetical protein